MDLSKMLNIIKSKDGDPVVKWVDSTLSKNMNKDFIKRMFEKNPKSISDPENHKRTMTHFMEVSDGMAYPRVVNIGGKLQLLNSDDAYNYALKSGEFIKFKNDDEAVKFTENYKKGTGVTIGK